MRVRGARTIAAVLVLVGSLVAGFGPPAWSQVPTESDVYVDRGLLAYDAQHYLEALQAFQEALRLNPKNTNALYYAGLTYMAVGRPAEAEAVLEQARQLAPADEDIAFQLGVADFSQQKYDQAEPLFRQVYAAQPQRPNIGYYLGFLEYRKQNYREALRLFRAAKPSDQNFAQLIRFYSGLSLSALGMAGEARSAIEEAIRMQPVSPLTGPAERLRESLGAAAAAERRFHVDAKVGFFYDDNVTVNPFRSGDPTAEANRERSHRTMGELGVVRFQYTPLRTPDWEANIAYGLLQTLNNDVSHYNIQNHTGFGNLAYKSRLLDRPAVWNLSYQFDYISLGDHPFVSRHTVAPALTVAWDGMNLTQAQVRYQYKNFYDEKNLVVTSDNRDANNYMAGVTHVFRFDSDRHLIRIGYQFDDEATKGSNWNYLGHRFLLGGQYTLPWWELRFNYDFDVQYRGYKNLNTILPTLSPGTIHRSDWDMNHLFSLAKDFPNNLTVSVEYLLNRNFSNLAVYDYIRNVVSFNVSWRY